MIDELELAWEEDAGRRRPVRSHRRGASPQRGRKKKRRRGRTVMALFVVLLLLGGLGASAWWGMDRIQGFFSTPDYTTGGTGEVMVEIKQGQTVTDIANTLYNAGVVKSAKAFVDAAESNSRSRNIQPGSYKLRTQMRASDALAMLLDLKNKVVDTVTIPEGRSAKQVFGLLSKATGIPVAQFEAAAKDPVALGVAADWFQRDDRKPVTKSIEGFLFPATYELNPKATAPQILGDMVNKFNQVAEELHFKQRVRAERHISPYEALMVASLAQAEAGNPDDLAKVARVAYNRVYVGSAELPCRCLQMDVTVNYWWELTGKPTKASKDMTDADLHNAANPYNTHDKPGLPPTPINNPGKLALQGAMAPATGGWFYFVAIDKAGHSIFAVTYAEQQRNEQRSCAAKIIC
ncbi:MAG TPA: endolytic transglycosylase MltG [Micromonosporaceae bacterium]|nr:endolytic transglycosylase MltG [Micromonosporaceae bacterium]